MKRWRPRAYRAGILVAAMALCGTLGCRPRQPAERLTWPSVELTPQDRILILAPHPDDEVLGCGGVIQQAVAMRLPIRIVLLTYGDNNQWSFLVYRRHPVFMPKAIQGMGLVRHDEALEAASLLGVDPSHITFLGYPDFGTLQIWKAHWGTRPPFRSMLTRVTAVPYANALRPGAPYKGEEILRDLTTILREFHPTKIFVSHPSDAMPDHGALYLFTRVALWDLEREEQPAALYPYLVHFKQWPSQRGYRPHEALEPPPSLREDIPWQAYPVRPEAMEHKRRALEAHRSQYAYSAKYLLSFVRANELFGDFRTAELRPSAATVSFERQPPGLSIEEAPEELTDQERAAFVGVETRSVQLTDDALVLTIALSRPLAKAVQASVLLFGYRSDRPFAEMPKLRLTLGALEETVYDQDLRLTDGGVQVTRHAKELTMRVPLKTLGNPQRVLFGARTYLEEVPLDWVSWRILELSPPR
ncbi:MAG: PIG-L family deacetylase [Candidatus Omnitrophica bacterium]|nr:PIG-L family deacetylase [Candidatus Omnitrophota bacterium]